MLKLNLVDKAKSDINYTIHKFPDGQQSITIEQPYGKIADQTIMIIARLNSFRHLEVIIAANQALREIGCTEIHLKVPYFLGSRSDRKFEEGSINYLKKVITPIVNSQGFKKVYVIDEVDRSLHTLLTHKLLDAYLATCSTETRTQLLLTTHDVLLMDQNLLRRDEMWVAERDASGNSSLMSFSEYKDIRYDKDIRKSYLQGRLGGIPRILLSGNFMTTSQSANIGEKR
jgi:AAA15 family ATPase/GTPase